MGADVIAELARRGHNIAVLRDFDDAMGHAHAIRVERAALSVGCDPRAESLALGT